MYTRKERRKKEEKKKKSTKRKKGLNAGEGKKGPSRVKTNPKRRERKIKGGKERKREENKLCPPSSVFVVAMCVCVCVCVGLRSPPRQAGKDA